MATDSRHTTSEILISRRPKKTRIRTNATGNRDPNNLNLNLNVNATTTTTNNIIPHTSPIHPTKTKLPVLYYLTRDGHIEHPHLIDVPLASPQGLYLRDVINTLNHHRGKGMANMYSWSIKRSYKNGFVWHDLSEDDLIEVTNGHDYVLKGSELLQTHDPSQTRNRAGEDTPTAMIRRQNQSWSSFDNPQEYMVVKCESSRELAANFAADAATQTEEQRRRQSFEGRKENVAVGLRRQDLTSPPPPSNTSSEEARYVDPSVTMEGSGRMKASQLLMQLISCGAPSSRLKM